MDFTVFGTDILINVERGKADAVNCLQTLAQT